MIDAFLLAIVCGTAALALTVDLGMLLTWMLRGRWK
jgi:hypothetical protein